MADMRASRLLSILLLLQLRGRITAETLAAEFGVSVRTVYRDIDTLSGAGFPIYSDRGPGGGFQFLDGYRSQLSGLAAEEARAMFMIGLPGPAEALGLGPAAMQAGRKLLASLPSKWSEQATRIHACFHLDPVDWYRAAEPAAHLPDIARAVLEQRMVSMRYDSWTGSRDWRVEPLGLVLKAGAWYLVARGAGKIRMFKVANMHAQCVLEQTFERPVDFDLPAYWAAELERFEAGLRPLRAILRASPTGLKRLAAQGAYAAEAVRASIPVANGETELELPFENIEQAAQMLLGLGPELEVLEPATLRQRIRELALEIADRHC